MTNSQTNDNLKEFQIFSKYIVNRNAKPEIAKRYSHILSLSGADSGDRYLESSLNHPWLLPYLDSYLAVVHPFSALRQRLYIAFSVLETDTDYSEQFLSERKPKIYILYIVFVGMRSVYRFVVGTLIAGYIKTFS